MSTAKAGMEGAAPRLETGTGNPEAIKYGKVWAHDKYREVAPGEQLAQIFLSQAKPAQGATVVDFGCGTGRGAVALAALGGLKVTMVDFVNNCLDPDVRQMLTTQAQALTFQKADLERGPLPHAEYGYCTDVMEHIPTDKVDTVLNNILTAARHVFFSISTVDDSLGSLVGETLHLTVQPAAWWLQKFNERGCLVHWQQELQDMSGRVAAVLFYVSGWTDARAIMDECVLNVGQETVEANVRHNIQQGWQQAAPHAVNDMEVMILGGGPTMAEYEDDIRAKRAAGVKLITLNGAYNWCLERGITPSATIIVDARPFNARFTKPVVDGCKYLISSQCDPSVFDGLPRDRTFLWHTSAEFIREALTSQYEQWWGIPGGSTVLLRAIPLLRMLGFKRFHLYGCDSCLIGDEHHAYAQRENDDQLVVPVTVDADGVVAAREMVNGGRVFYCTAWMLSQAQEFCDLVKVFGDEIDLEIYGDGLLRHIMEVGADALEYAESLR